MGKSYRTKPDDSMSRGRKNQAYDRRVRREIDREVRKNITKYETKRGLHDYGFDEERDWNEE